MPLGTQEIVNKLWNLCNVLRDDGITYHQYLNELTYILFLKMAEETGADKDIPEGYRWSDLKHKEGIELATFYRQLLLDPMRHCTAHDYCSTMEVVTASIVSQAC